MFFLTAVGAKPLLSFPHPLTCVLLPIYQYIIAESKAYTNTTARQPAFVCTSTKKEEIKTKLTHMACFFRAGVGGGQSSEEVVAGQLMEVM